MSYSNTPRNLTVQEQIVQAESKFKELLKADAEFYELKQLLNKTKVLREQLKDDSPGVEKISITTIKS